MKTINGDKIAIMLPGLRTLLDAKQYLNTLAIYYQRHGETELQLWYENGYVALLDLMYKRFIK